MELQKIFKQEYADKLYDEIRPKKGKSSNILKANLEKYDKESFNYDSSQTMFISGVYKPEGLLDRMMKDIDDDYACAIHLFNAYRNLKPIQAADKAFWIYLSHVDLFPYVQKKFGEKYNLDKEDGLKKKINSVGVHWFFQREVVRNALAGLWWDVKCTIIDNPVDGDEYKYTKVLFNYYDLRMINFANYALFRNKNQVIAMLDYFLNHPELTSSNFQVRSRYITKYFNMLGARKQLAYLPQSFFKNEMDAIYDDVMNLPQKK